MIRRKTESLGFTDPNAMWIQELASGTQRGDGTILNWIRGIIDSHHVGLVRSGIRLRIGQRTDLRVRWMKKEQRRFVIGQSVIP